MSPAAFSKIGDGGVRTALYEAANIILTRPVKGSTLKSWGMRLAGRAGSGGSRPSCPEQGPVAGTMDQAKPMTFQQSFATLLLIRPHQEAAVRRPRTEARHQR